MKIVKSIPLFMVVIVLLTSICSAADSWTVLYRSPGQIQAMSLLTDQRVMIAEEMRLITVQKDSNPQAVNFAANERCFVASDGSCYAVIRYEGGADVVSAAMVTLFRSDGQPQWTIGKHLMNDIVPLRNGGAVAAHRNISIKQNFVYFIDSSGRIVKQIEIAALGQIMASPTGDRILISSGVEGALLFDHQGVMISKLDEAYRMAFSDDGRWCALLYGPNVKIYNEGTPVYAGNLGGELPRGVSFNGDNSRLAAFTDHGLFILSIPSGKILMQRQLDTNEQLSFSSIDIMADGSLIAAGVERDLGSSVKGPERHPDGEIRLYDPKGTMLHQQPISYTAWNTTTPRVRFGNDDENLFVLTRDEVLQAAVTDLSGKGGVR
ncbi:MAG: hypothetical protein ABIE92_15095 [bacterium]